jgi:hypothetical protein
VTLAFNQVGAGHIVELASKTVTGPLRFELERYIDTHRQTNNVARVAVPWDGIRIHISTQFLNVDESSALRDEVQHLQQSAYEPEVAYSRWFREVADAVYPEALHNPDQEYILVCFFAKGLTSGTMACKFVEETNPIC